MSLNIYEWAQHCWKVQIVKYASDQFEGNDEKTREQCLSREVCVWYHEGYEEYKKHILKVGKIGLCLILSHRKYFDLGYIVPIRSFVCVLSALFLWKLSFVLDFFLIGLINTCRRAFWKRRNFSKPCHL